MACRFSERGVIAASFREHARRFRDNDILLCASSTCAEPPEISAAKPLKLLAEARSLHSRLLVKARQHQRDLMPPWLGNEVIPWLPVLCAYYGQCCTALCTVEAWKSQLWPYTGARERISNISNMYKMSRKRIPNPLAPLRSRREMKQMLITTLWEWFCGRGPIFWAHTEMQAEEAPLEILSLCY